MKRIILLVLAGVFGALGLWYVLQLGKKDSREAIAALVPRDASSFVHVPDFNRSRDQWHDTDLYKLYREPAVQAFLHGSIDKMRSAGTSETVEDLRALDPKDIFIATVPAAGSIYVGGFRRSRDAAADRAITKWKAKLEEKFGASRRETTAYQNRKIDSLSRDGITVAATVEAGDWFLAANDLAQLKALLDRVDGRNVHANGTLNADESFARAVAHMPGRYAAMVYWQPKSFADSMKALREVIGRPVNANDQMLETVRSVCAAIRFEKGKMRDTVFVGMPQPAKSLTLTRASLPLATADTFLYIASILDMRQYVDVATAAGSDPASHFGRIAQAAAAAGVTPDEWDAAFGPEIAVHGDWTQAARWPALFVTLPVKDRAHAHKIVTALTSSHAGAGWSQTEKEGVHYFSQSMNFGLLPLNPTIAVSDRMLVAGLVPGWTEKMITRSSVLGAGFANSQAFKDATRSLPDARSLFGYVDVPLLYARLDATLRPILQMAAAFAPSSSKDVDLTKLPDVETVTKHLSPIISSHSYHRDGYVMESIGPVTFSQAVIGSVAFGTIGYAAYDKASKGAGSLFPGILSPSKPPNRATAPAASPQSPTPSQTP